MNHFHFDWSNHRNILENLEICFILGRVEVNLWGPGAFMSVFCLTGSSLKIWLGWHFILWVFLHSFSIWLHATCTNQDFLSVYTLVRDQGLHCKTPYDLLTDLVLWLGSPVGTLWSTRLACCIDGVHRLDICFIHVHCHKRLWVGLKAV